MFGVLADNNKLVANFKSNWNHMNRAHPNFGLNTKIGYKEWWRRVVMGKDKSVEFCFVNRKRHSLDYKT